MTKDFQAGIRELLFQDVPDYIRSLAHYLWVATAPLRAFAIDRALILTVAFWLTVVLVFLFFLPFGNNRNPLNPSDWLGKNDATGLRDYLWAMSFPLGALLVSLTLVNALRRTRIMDIQAGTAERELEANISGKRDELNISTFTKSVEMLDSDLVMTRVGAIYSLEEILRASLCDTDRILFSKQIVDTICAYIREKLKIDSELDKSNDTDTLSAVSVISRSWNDESRKTNNSTLKLNLSRCNFSNIFNDDTLNLNYCNFDDSNFDFLWMTMRSINRSSFNRSNIDNCNIIITQFENCDFFSTSFNDSDLRSCDFVNCNFWFSKGSGTDFSYSRFKNCRLYECNFNKVNVSSCSFDFDEHLIEEEKKSFRSFIEQSHWETTPNIPEWANEFQSPPD